jgi:eukaryotic-like serine/threonine-protein kinase
MANALEVDTTEAGPREQQINLAIYDFHARVDRGEQVDRRLWLEEHEEIADELRAYLEDLSGISIATSVDHTARQFRVGEILGDFRLIEKIAEGGQGIVWKASPCQFSEVVVAIKTMNAPSLNDQAAIYRFREDARAIARMNHPHIIRTTYVGEESGRWFFVMDLMEGGTVADRLSTYQADPRGATIIVEKIARAIHHAHTRNEGVIHLDLKPGNVLLNLDGEPKVTDFGLAVRSEAIQQAVETADSDHESEVRSGPLETFARAGIVGTIPYMSPEMAQGRWEDVCTLSDVYGLGAILYAMLTGRPPFSGANTVETLEGVVRGDLVQPRVINRQVDHELNAICLKCLNRNLAARYGSADALANDLRRWLERKPTLAGGKASVVREFRFWFRRNPFPLLLAVAAVLSLWGVSFANMLGQTKSENAREAARLANQLDRELTMIRAFAGKLAKERKLVAAFEDHQDHADFARRQAAVQRFLSSVDVDKWFDVAGGNPFVNVFILDEQGVELADNLSENSAIGKRFDVRDYFQALIHGGVPSDFVHVARSFQSLKDNRYKIAVSTGIWSNDRQMLGVLVANFSIGHRLLGFDLSLESNEAFVLCPIDPSNPKTGQFEPPGTDWRYSPILARNYPDDTTVIPEEVQSPILTHFQRDPKLRQSTIGPSGGKVVEYRRVGSTNLIVVSERACPWPLSWLP